MPHKWLNKVEGGPPTYPENTSPGVPNPPPNTTWDDFAYVIGGYGWKARFVKKDGRIFTAGDSAQYNLANGGWAPYHKDEEKTYNYWRLAPNATPPDRHRKARGTAWRRTVWARLPNRAFAARAATGRVASTWPVRAR
ncbi:MAG: hypothetical protein Q9P14_14120 [candidate division KSB1 bacterium]|nr:hypothetical protein [candidate division KSB1 bacterium]